MDALLKVEDLHVNFKTPFGIAKVLNGVSLYIKPQEIVSLVGETGCGKSITAKSILDVLPETSIVSGKISLKDKDFLSIGKKERRTLIRSRIGYIPQNPMTSLNPVFTIGEVFFDLIKWHGKEIVPWRAYRRWKRHIKEERDIAIELLKKVHLPQPEDVLSKYPTQLSGGMRQRVLIAMSMVGNREFLIADEPTTALDVTIQKGIVELIKEKVEEERLSVLYITHNLGVAKYLSNRIYVMYAGDIVEFGPSESLLRNPLHPYTQGLLNSIPKLIKTGFSGIPGRLPSYITPPKGCRFSPRCPKSTDICNSIKPPLIEVEEGHFVRCHLYGKDN